MKATGIFALLLSQDGFEIDYAEKLVLNNHFLKSLQKEPYADVLQVVLRNFATFTGNILAACI